MARTPDSLITALGFSLDEERLYTRILAQNGRELLSAAASLSRDPDALVSDLAPFLSQGIARLEEGRLYVANPGEALALLLRETADSAAKAEAQLRDVAAALPFLSATSARPRLGEVRDVEAIDGEVSSGGQVVGLLTALMTQSRGDFLWFRPDQWRVPEADPMADVLADLIAAGRQSRAIYPIRALSEAPGTLELRAEIGEQIRVVPELPTRLLIIGRSHVILPEPLGLVDEPRTLLRQRGLVDALTMWFEELWERAVPVPQTSGGSSSPDLRRFLMQQLAAGAQDEQIARRLGISLRTVRRRVAEVMSELGAESRFQAGVEAVRRGWL